MAVHDLAKQVAVDTGQLTLRCYGCARCSAGCPVSFATDLKTHQVIRLVNLGQLDKLLQSKAIWLCAFCKTCKQRCPNDIDGSEVIDWLKHKALEKKVTPALPNIPILYEVFMDSVEKLGRVYEAGWIGVYKIKTKTYTKDLKLGLKMIKKRKIKLLPGRIKNYRQIKEIFERARKG
ncbi:4Fe-4S dicluster domain-containing protein [Desulfofalx alkaliphila]|uniref:4Fe-4S dicluster domain-containing protein n=1 Tax=Desulfofalx alkaliphila TaxID=105483 RepID=UPI0012FE8989|nr:4Fe-4S dicluster domain-containing protein [Desulfofalx alkaliphila]